jgi:Xaa-Pro aminopeptidase
MTFGRMNTDREERINYPRMREYRLNRAREQLKKDGIGCLITWEGWNVRYLTGNYVTIPTRWVEQQAVILPVNGDPYVYGGASFSPYRLREEMPWLKGKLYSSKGSVKISTEKEQVAGWVNEVKRIMDEHGLKNEPLGLDGSTSQLLLSEAFKDVGIKVVDAKMPMFKARAIKNQDELECTRIACAFADAAFADMTDAIRPGVAECELVGIGMKTIHSLGADETQEFVCVSGPLTNPLRIDYTDRLVQPGDLVVIDVNGCSFQGYKSCYYRTFCCGKATAEQKAIYEECRAMMYAGMNSVKAGNTTWDIAKNWPDSPKYWGYDQWEDVGGYAVGHGVGISLHEFPFVLHEYSRVNPQKLEEGMVIALETWAGKKGGRDGVRLEEMVAVTKDGYELLTRWPVDQVTECWR